MSADAWLTAWLEHCRQAWDALQMRLEGERALRAAERAAERYGGAPPREEPRG
jgi:hypothetical protein